MKFYGKKSFRPSDLVLVGDQILILLGLASALFAHYRILNIAEFPFETTLYFGLIHVGLGILAWITFGVYKKVIRFFNSSDYLNLIGIVFLIHVLSVFIGYLLPAKYQLRPEVFLISFFITSIYITGSRMIISYLYTYYRKAKKIGPEKRILIYGAGHLGVFLKKSIYNSSDQYKLMAFLDDDKNKIGRFVEGVKVIPSDDGLEDFVREHEVTDIIIANKSLTPSRKAKFLETTLKLNIRIKEINSIKSLLSNFNIDKLASIDINDLMNREVIELFDKHVADNLEGKTVMVTGAAGSIGSEIVRKLAKHNASLIICVDFSESALYDLQQELKRTYPKSEFRFMLVDVRNEELVREVFKAYRPNFIYHAAAYKHVPLMEQFPWQAVQINIMATWQIVKMAIEFKAEKFVFISSDKAVHPTSVMGATKRLAEIIVQCYSCQSTFTKFAITRFGNVLGSNGSVVPLFKKQIQQGGPVTVTHPDMTRYFMTIAEACQLVLEASIMSKGGEVFVFDMGQPVKIVDLAKNMIRLAGYVPDVDMQIKFIGERPGEKLYEELFLETEKLKETHHEKIMISTEDEHDISEADHIVATFLSMQSNWNPDDYRVAIKSLLPEYKLNLTVDEKSVILKPNFITKEYNYQN
ncbi:MAG TPA: nucleoside-diphosphate sugar epimerase/dehydratase [Ferruginibacter sp.]|nr:nucleoside-diphosphate sugar epimerase/dehydratase [Ferruginibacter sp.]HRO07032.1 nucleoside-diphosphate sugar epimerase/dehydratase [Ferruginibacter sp.]HRO97303.1 nucleoside-diphosphate sugar epimerase/dehydratase [Ferruginibacter sp.]HRP50474.1 nucleoside-diphosphate sugar epimerase/dehydratase [Ferruginibacter sp.]